MSLLNLQPRLIGFAGHRNVPDRLALRQAIRRELRMMRETFGPRLTAISGAAAGADLVFLGACVELRIPTVVILPFPRQRFAEDFDDSEELKMAEHLMSVALAEYVAPGGKLAPEANQSVLRHLLEWADAFLFAWNGEPACGMDGTGEAVAEARDLGVPSRIIDAASLEVRWTFEPDMKRGARHGFRTRKELLEFLDSRLDGQPD